MNNRADVLKELNIIRTNMMELKIEAKDRMHEPMTNHLRMWHHLQQIEGSLNKMSWALMRLTDPYS